MKESEEPAVWWRVLVVLAAVYGAGWLLLALDGVPWF